MVDIPSAALLALADKLRGYGNESKAKAERKENTQPLIHHASYFRGAGMGEASAYFISAGEICELIDKAHKANRVHGEPRP